MTEDGSKEKFYVKLQPQYGQIVVTLEGAPSLPNNEHPSAVDLTTRYLEILKKMLRDASSVERIE